jgi:hypothetical protein
MSKIEAVIICPLNPYPCEIKKPLVECVRYCPNCKGISKDFEVICGVKE